MATTLLAVCNRALGKIGAPRINALTDDTPPALALAACLPGVPDWVLRAYRWRFALKRAVLAEADAVPAFGYGWSFTLPGDCLTTAPEADTADWTVEGRSLLTNETPRCGCGTSHRCRTPRCGTPYSPRCWRAASRWKCSPNSPLCAPKPRYRPPTNKPSLSPSAPAPSNSQCRGRGPPKRALLWTTRGSPPVCNAA